jgi:hypothetical protein
VYQNPFSYIDPAGLFVPALLLSPQGIALMSFMGNAVVTAIFTAMDECNDADDIVISAAMSGLFGAVGGPVLSLVKNRLMNAATGYLVGGAAAIGSQAAYISATGGDSSDANAGAYLGGAFGTAGAALALSNARFGPASSLVVGTFVASLAENGLGNIFNYLRPPRLEEAQNKDECECRD